MFCFSLKVNQNLMISPEDDTSLKISNPHLWWPNNLGDPYLYTLNIEANVNDKISDERNLNSVYEKSKII